MARKSKGGKADRVVIPASKTNPTGGVAIIPGGLAGLAKHDPHGVIARTFPQIGAALEAAAKAAGVGASGPVSHKPVDYSKFETIKDEDSDEEGPPCYCGARHSKGVHPGDEADDEDDEQHYSNGDSEDASDMPDLITDDKLPSIVDKNPAAVPAAAGAPAPAALAAAPKPKGIAKGFLAAGAPAKAANGGGGANKKSSGVEDVSDKDSDGNTPAGGGGSTPRPNGATARAAGGRGGGGKKPNGNGVVDEDDDSDADGPPGLTDTEEEVPRMRYSRPENFAAPAAAAAQAQPAPAPAAARPAAKAPAKKDDRAEAAKAKDRGKAPAASEAPKAPEPAKPATKPKAAKAAAAAPSGMASATPPPRQAKAKAAAKDDDEGLPGLMPNNLDEYNPPEPEPDATSDMPGLAAASNNDSGDDSDEVDATTNTYQPKWGAPAAYPTGSGRAPQKDEQRKRLEEKLRKKNETATAAQAAETLQQEQARLRAEAAERNARELMEEEEKLAAKKKKEAAKKKEKKAKKKKVAEPFVPQYIDEEEEAAQAAAQAAEAAKLAAEEEEKARAEKAESSAPREEQEEGIEDLMALADLKLGGAAAAADQLPKGKAKGKAKAGQQAADRGKAPVVGVQEALAFGGIQQRPALQPAKEAAPSKPARPTLKEISVILEQAMASSDGGELGNAIQRATDWLDNQPGSNKNVIKVQKQVERAVAKHDQLWTPTAPAPAPPAAASAPPRRPAPPLSPAPPRPVYNPMARNEAPQMPQPVANAFPSSVQALFGAPRPAAPGPGPPSPGLAGLRPAAAAPQQPYRAPPPYNPALSPAGPAAPRQQYAAQPPLPAPTKAPAAPTRQAPVPVASGDFLDDVAKERECCVCLENEKTMVFAPCGHHVTCKGCAEMIMSSNRLCPVCRTKIGEVYVVAF